MAMSISTWDRKMEDSAFAKKLLESSFRFHFAMRHRGDHRKWAKQRIKELRGIHETIKEKN